MFPIMKLSISNIIKRIFPSKESSSPNQNELPLSSQSEIQLRDDSNIERENDEQQGNLIPSLKELTSQMAGDEEEYVNISAVDGQSSTSLDERKGAGLSSLHIETKDEQEASLIPSLNQLASEIADDDDEGEDSSSADENTNALEEDEQIGSGVALSRQSTGAENLIPGLEEFTDETIDTTSSVGERSDEDENEDLLSIERDISSPIEDEASSLSIFSLDELAERMEVSHESKTKEESSKEKKREVSRKDLSNQKETFAPKSQVKEETSHDEASHPSESDYADLLPDISEAKARLARLERWHSIAVAKNITVRQKLLEKEIKKVEAAIDILMRSGKNQGE